jgi:hypothetical protein
MPVFPPETDQKIIDKGQMTEDGSQMTAIGSAPFFRLKRANSLMKAVTYNIRCHVLIDRSQIECGLATGPIVAKRNLVCRINPGDWMNPKI